MPIDRQRYPENWKKLSRAIKEAADWQCCRCGQQYLRPGEDASQLPCAERVVKTLNVHHANRIPEDNREENLMPICTVCHLALHAGRHSNVSPGQLSLW
jgi:5-methylcytosine-specific restriction endonuclease McrA